MAVTKTFRLSGALVVAGVLLLTISSAGAPGPFWGRAGMALLLLAGPVFGVSAVRHLLRGLLWRVGSRLLVSYLLLVVPFVFLLGVIYAGVWLVAAQVAARRLEVALEKRQVGLEKTARLLADVFDSAKDAATRRALFEEGIRPLGEVGDLGCSYLPAGGVPEILSTPPAPQLLPRPWIPPGPSYVITPIGSSRALAATDRRPAGTLVLSLRTGPAFRAAFERELGMVLDLRQTRTTLSLGRRKVDLLPVEPGHEATASAAPPAGTGPIFGRWIYYPVSLRVPAVDWETGRPLPDERLVLVLGTSVATEADRLFGEVRVGVGALRSADLALKVMKFLSGGAAVVFLLAILAAAVLASRIARATRRLSQGVAEIEKGNFAHRVELKGDDQLARLVRGFNEMASHLEASVRERAEKQALERELQVARDLQRRLLPPADFVFPGLALAVDFHPAAAIGGDFYDLVPGALPGVLTVVLADVSGHGLPTGIVMASAKASLTALLRSEVPGEELLSRLDAEIARTTDSRTFVTMALLRFDLAGRRLAYTNAGHVYPYRVTTAGTVSSLPNPARPLGLGLPVAFKTLEAPLDNGDLWILLSDGIVEATRDGSDEEFGFARLERALAGVAGGTASEARDRVLAVWRDFTGTDEPSDDRTLLVLRIGDRPTAVPKA